MNEMNYWNNIRARNVGGSEVSALFGASPYMSKLKLWLIKAGEIQPDDLSGNEVVEAGNRYEGAVVDWARDKYGVRYYRPQVYVTHSTVAGMGCTPDAFVEGNRLVIAQAKCITRTKGWSFEGDFCTDAPLHIMLQCQHEMACCGAEENHLIVARGMTGISRMVIYRDEEIISQLEQAVASFWVSIKSGDRPSPDYDRDLSLMRARTCDGTCIDLSGNNRFVEAARSYIEAKEEIKRLEGVVDASMCELLDIVGGAAEATAGDISVKRVERKGTPDKIITQDMVGNVIKGRAGSSFLKVTAKGEF